MSRFVRRVIHVSAYDSPNVKAALARVAAGLDPGDPEVVPGVVTWAQLQERLRLWAGDEEKISVAVHGRFYQGDSQKLFPTAWLNRASLASLVAACRARKAEAVGIDPGQGKASTAMAAVNARGVVELVARKTPDTAVIRADALAFLRRHGVPPERCCFDAGGGGLQIADGMRADGYAVRTVAFGATVAPEPRRGRHALGDRRHAREERQAFRNVRALMYWQVREMLDPAGNPDGFAIPPECAELLRQMGPIPLTYERGEGKLYVLPKEKSHEGDTRPTLTQLLGSSPDELDSVVLAVHALLHAPVRARAGAV